ncbi:MAG: Xaa-Pro peptidase family protein [Pseudomonadota bacterium]
MYQTRQARFCAALRDAGVDTAIITDDDNVYYLCGYYDYLHMDFGRPTLLVMTASGESVLITPQMEWDMARASAQVDRIAAWNDGAGDEWRSELPSLLGGVNKAGLEPDAMPPPVARAVRELVAEPLDITPLLADLRMIKSADEIQLAEHAGEVANAMMAAGRDAIGAGVAEFEVALATTAAGTRKSAELLAAHYDDACMSPNTHFLQIMASGSEITKPHHRASTRVMQYGEPVFLCFCGMTNFHRFKLGFDRTFWIDDLSDSLHERLYSVAVDSQRAALDALQPGVTAESVHAAYAEVIQSAGFDYPFRCGRATGYSFLEKPQLVTGDTTVIQPGMVLAVDGSVSQSGVFRAQVGDSVVVTETGWRPLTSFPKALEDVVLK